MSVQKSLTAEYDVVRFDPDNWFTSLFRALASYVNSEYDGDLYEMIWSYPSPREMRDLLPLEKTVVHFEIDDIRPSPLGLGPSTPADEEVGDTLVAWEATRQEVTFDIGIWASAASGGVSARLSAYEGLSKLFSGPNARAACLEATDGIEILSFQGGRFVTDTINDVPLYRVIDISLDVRVFSRVKLDPETKIEQINQEPGIEIDQIVIVDVTE